MHCVFTQGFKDIERLSSIDLSEVFSKVLVDVRYVLRYVLDGRHSDRFYILTNPFIVLAFKELVAANLADVYAAESSTLETEFSLGSQLG